MTTLQLSSRTHKALEPMGLIIDLFSGAGGASLGIAWAWRHPDHGINHSHEALRNHRLNHETTQHHVDDVRKVVPLVLTGGHPVDLLWASPDCRHFSRAKGGKPCNPKIRTLPWEITRWAREARPTVICVENVPEMDTWGPLETEHSHGCKSLATLECDHASYESYARCRKHNNTDPTPLEKCSTKLCRFAKPVAELSGTTWAAWLQAFRDAGYEVDSWVLHAHHYGAPTSRKRLFIVARRDGVKPQKPARTHGEGLLPVKTAADCIDWSDLGESIFDADGNTHHADATLRRIATGVMRFVVKAKKPFIVTCNHGKPGFRGQDVDEPFKTLTASHDAHGLVSPLLVATGYGERAGQDPRTHDVQGPHPTVVAGGVKTRLVAAFLAKHNTGVVGHEVDRALGTITGTDHHSVVAAHLTKFYGTSTSGASVEDPMPTVTANDRGGGHAAVVAAFLSTYYGNGDNNHAVDEPMATQTTKHRHSVVTVEIDGVTYAIVDIRMRMLKPNELKRAQGFPESYRLEGPQKTQIRLIGNSVPPQLAEAVVRANMPRRRRAA